MCMTVTRPNGAIRVGPPERTVRYGRGVPPSTNFSLKVSARITSRHKNASTSQTCGEWCRVFHKSDLWEGLVMYDTVCRTLHLM